MLREADNRMRAIRFSQPLPARNVQSVLLFYSICPG